jgi:predicted enzyme related to lactoylglutathione lyase
VFKKLRTVIYHVNNLDEAKQWYAAVTGIKPYFDEPFYVGFDVNGYELGLDPDESGVTGGNQSVAYWAVDNIHAVVEKLTTAGATVISGVQNVGGTIETAVVKDPFGNAIGLIEGS